MTTVFTPIILGQEEKQRIFWEDDAHVAFLTHRPHTRGHTLVVPKKEYRTYNDMPESEYLSYMSVCRKISDALNEIFKPKHVSFAISGFEVPHVHVHLIPVNRAEEMNTEMAHDATVEELQEVSDLIRSKINF
jgi:histidine triad (HIT) family protein